MASVTACCGVDIGWLAGITTTCRDGVRAKPIADPVAVKADGSGEGAAAGCLQAGLQAGLQSRMPGQSAAGQDKLIAGATAAT